MSNTAWDISNAEYNTYFYYGGSSSSAQSLFFGDNGSKFYIHYSNGIKEYGLTTAWDLDTASYSQGDSYTWTDGGYTSAINGFWFKSDGSVLYEIAKLGTDTQIREITLSTDWDITSGTLGDTKSLGNGYQLINFSDDGTKIYFGDEDWNTTANIYQWNLSTAWDITTASNSGNSFSIGYDVTDFQVTDSGDKLYVLKYSDDKVYQFNLSTTGDISTASSASVSFDSSESSSPYCFRICENGRKLYLNDTSSDRLYYYTIPVDANSERSLYSYGKTTGNSEKDLYTVGRILTNSERNLYSSGIDTTNSERFLYSYGILDGTALYKNLTIKKDNSAIRNRVYVRGGTYLSDEVTIKQVADGQQTVFNLPEKPHEVSILEGVTSKTVGIKNIDDFTDYDYLMSYQEKYVETETAPAVDTIITFSFKYDIPVLVAVEDRDSIEKYGQLEYIIFDKNIDTIAQARERASAELTDYAESIIEGSFETETTGFKAGQSLSVTLSDLDIDETFVVKSVKAKSIGGGNFIYKINIVSAEMLGIIGFLVSLLESDKNSLNISSDETVDEIKTITGESFNLSDGTPVVDLNSDPFKYDSNAEWDIAEWES